MPKRTPKVELPPRERLLAAAYDLFAAKGVNRVGIDTILEQADCAKASLYDNFSSKVDLAIAFLDRREQVWTRDWLEFEVRRRASDPEGRLLAIFDVFDGWFRKKEFEGCSFINVLLELAPEFSDPGGGGSAPGQDPRYREWSRQRRRPTRTRKIRSSLAHADEGIDRDGGRRQS